MSEFSESLLQYLFLINVLDKKALSYSQNLTSKTINFSKRFHFVTNLVYIFCTVVKGQIKMV